MLSDTADSSRQILLFDVSLGDAGISAGASLSRDEKVALATQIAVLGVDGIVAGLPMQSPGDFAAVSAIAQKSLDWAHAPVIAAVARPVVAEIETCWRAIGAARRPRIIVACTASALGLGSSASDAGRVAGALQQVTEFVGHARSLCADVQLSLSDAPLGSGPVDALAALASAAFGAGASTFCLMDARGYALPGEIQGVVAALASACAGAGAIGIGARDDLGLATANALAAVLAGAAQVEGAVTGFGERAGTVALEELAMILDSRRHILKLRTNLNCGEIYGTARLAATLAGVPIPRHKAVLGAGALPRSWGLRADAGRSGPIEQEDPVTLDAANIGRPDRDARLAAGLDLAAFASQLTNAGLRVAAGRLEAIYAGYLELCERRHFATVGDLEALAAGDLVGVAAAFALRDFVIRTGAHTPPEATVSLVMPDEEEQEATATGDGPVDAMYRAVDLITGLRVMLLDYALTAATSGKDALGQVSVKLEYKGQVFTGRGVSTDVLAASLLAYVHALNKIAAARAAAGQVHFNPLQL